MREVIVPVLVKFERPDGEKEYFLGNTLDDVLREVRVNFHDRGYLSHAIVPLQRPPSIRYRRYTQGIVSVKRGTSRTYYLGISH